MPMLYTPILGHCFLSHSHISLVLFWIKKSSSIYHVLSYIWNKWNSIRVFAIQVAQHRIPEWKNKRLFCRKLKKAANLPDFSVLSTLWYFPHPAFFWNWWTVMKRNVFKGLLQKFEQGCTEMPKVRANVKPPRIEATWLWREILQKAMMSIQKQYIILYTYIYMTCLSILSYSFHISHSLSTLWMADLISHLHISRKFQARQDKTREG